MLYNINNYIEILKREIKELEYCSFSSEDYGEGYRDGLERAVKMLDEMDKGSKVLK